MASKITTEDFIERAIKEHGDRYDYSKSVYKRSNMPIVITCKKHGDFLQSPNGHLAGRNCFECSGKKKQDIKTFLRRAKNIHGDKYDYSKVVLKNFKTPIIITCEKHGDFSMSPSHHLNLKQNCKKCTMPPRHKLNTDIFIKKAKNTHGDRYDYSKSVYERSNIPIIITCKKHGDFMQRPNNHLRHQGCPKCYKKRHYKDV